MTMDINDLPFEDALDLYYELLHAIEADDEHTIKELSALYPSLFEEQNLQSLAETAERVKRITKQHQIPPLPETHTRRARIKFQLDRVNRLVRENPTFFGDNPNSGALYIELAIDKLESVICNHYDPATVPFDRTGKIVAFKPKPKNKK